MKRFLAMASASLALVLPSAMAQGDTTAQPTPPVSEAETAAAQSLMNALEGFYVAILQNPAGGMVSLKMKDGSDALLAFLSPEAVGAARTAAQDPELQVGIIPLADLMANWDGVVVFESGASEIQEAAKLSDQEQPFGAPVYTVISDGHEVQMQSESGLVTPILTGHADAAELASALKQGDLKDTNIEIAPLEISDVLRLIGTPGEKPAYRLYTHPKMVALMAAAESAQSAPTE
ncbi:hypothetical protein [Henriciella litoralis]|uniref:hypothetical protein n=1 Tax=Henriciella litoralis TaxID=568102 RepID=UPI00111C7426|nr:hypothetical protein [Henriciella litoralis]